MLFVGAHPLYAHCVTCSYDLFVLEQEGLRGFGGWEITGAYIDNCCRSFLFVACPASGSVANLKGAKAVNITQRLEQVDDPRLVPVVTPYLCTTNINKVTFHRPTGLCFSSCPIDKVAADADCAELICSEHSLFNFFDVILERSQET